MSYLFILSAYVALTLGRAQAQTTMNLDPPDLKLVDSAGINVVSGKPQLNSAPVSIGPKDSALTFKLDFNGDAIRLNNADGFWGEISTTKVWEGYQSESVNFEVRLFNNSDFFRTNETMSRRRTGSTLLRKDDGSYEYISRDGVRYITDPSIKGRAFDSAVNMAITKVIYPNGREIYIKRSTGTLTPVQLVTTNDGYQLRYSYDATGNLTSVTAVNMAVDYCDPAAGSCSYSRSWPTAKIFLDSRVVNSVGPTTLTITDSANQVTKYFSDSGYQGAGYYERLNSVKWASSAAATTVKFAYGSMFVCSYDGSLSVPIIGCAKLRDIVNSVDIGDSHWSYSYRQAYQNPPYQAGLDGVWITTATAPTGMVTSAQYDLRRSVTTWVTATAPNSYGGSQSYGLYNRITSAIDSEGRNFSFTYDDRGNLLSKTQTDTGGAGTLVLQANYDEACKNPVTCNKPNWIKDANGNQTDYTYDPVHGGILSETSTPDSNGIRPQKRYTYTSRTAMIKNIVGGYSAAGAPIWLLDTLSYCRTSNFKSTGTGCQAPDDEVITQYDYGPISGPNNLLLRGKVTTAGGISRRSCYAYDVLGNMISETTPNAGLARCY
ncbi:RHS repeat domain-containing protein [Massilia phyllosphaerae]|uniref:RHS repeat domain-containing protein n=1 Tax=Massilia phyllosphaerae TaxID=3106034 RepID=UPI002B1CCCCA|nr:RHS repeat domain-containing protein [Massilia sp. SGZ-792]